MWSSIRAADYTAWQADKTSGKPVAFTDQWIADRATLLQALVTRNTQNNTTGQIFDASAPAGQVTFFDFVDPANPAIKTILSTLSQGATTLPNQYIAFGGEGAESLIGTDNKLADHLYGGAGADTLNGKGGNDYLEGGVGSDTYQFTDQFGNDTVLDADGLGSIQIGTDTLTGGKQLSKNLWESEDKRYLYTLQTDASGSSNLIITYARQGESAVSNAWGKTNRTVSGGRICAIDSIAGYAYSTGAIGRFFMKPQAVNASDWRITA
jgi:Ca2+-binding RTX toxin-like protein